MNWNAVSIERRNIFMRKATDEDDEALQVNSRGPLKKTRTSRPQPIVKGCPGENN